MFLTDNEFRQKIRNYYLMLEEDFLSTKSIVLIDKCNFKTCGLRYLNIIQACCGEIDSLLTIFYKSKTQDVESDRANINKLWYFAQNELFIMEDENKIHLQDYEITAVSYDIKLKPWDNYYVMENYDTKGRKRYNGAAPKWWTDYNKLKHNRINLKLGDKNNFLEANLANALNSLSALYLVLLGLINYFNYQSILSSIDAQSRLFNENKVTTYDDIGEIFAE